ncbi:extracellular solute-binding protein [Gimesia chilikensis]|uniref:extracellular solute-binding protein n=1 Tax=Gimesia chilikensis TaxID=2605989 RepID=UPI0011ECA0FA|nr:extracellular solute-binding protein [Gimesia chilikensis]KAA0139274.1 extracellular solute-binding protein [Gimesia chilikensis]
MNEQIRPQGAPDWLTLIIILLLALLGIGVVFYYQKQTDPLVVYCAHDSIFSEKILNEFMAETGIAVEPRFDTEATKSLGLTNLIIREQEHPQCDVFWNNQTLGTADLKSRGLLESYKGSGYERIPESFKDPEGCWTGFAARLRVFITNTNQLQADSAAIEKVLAGPLDQVAIAKPLYGTTLTHFTILCDVWGLDQLKAWYAEQLKRGIQVTTGNSQVKNLVAGGACVLGYTDTDDYFVAVDEQQPVAAIPVTIEDKVILIPNSVAIIKGTQKREQAEKLVDFLLSERVELELARSQSRQIPLGPVDWEQVPEEVKQYRSEIEKAYPLTNLVKQREQTLDWLKTEYLK